MVREHRVPDRLLTQLEKLVLERMPPPRRDLVLPVFPDRIDRLFGVLEAMGAWITEMDGRGRLLYVSPGLLRRGWPFFALYLVLFAALTLVDGLSLTLFVQQVGADWLPGYQAFADFIKDEDLRGLDPIQPKVISCEPKTTHPDQIILEIRDITGKLIYQTTRHASGNESVEIIWSDLREGSRTSSGGIYLLSLRTSKQVLVKKIVKQ